MATIVCTTETLEITVSSGTIGETSTGSVDVTLPAWTFSGTGFLAAVIEETFTVRGEANPEEIVADTFVMSDSTEFFFDMLIEDTVEFSDEVVDDEVIARLSDTFLADDDVEFSYVYHLFDNTVEFGDVATPAIIALESHTVEFSDEVTFSRTLLVEDSFTVEDTPIPSGSAAQFVSSTFVVSDVVVQVATGELIEESFTVEDTVVSTSTDVTITLTETVNISDSVEEAFGSSAALLISDAFTVEDSFPAASSTYNTTISSTFLMDDSIWARDYNALGWVMNSETAGLTRYDNFGYDSLAEYNGVLYATSPEGIHAFDADTDNSRYIAARYKTGFEDFETGRKKRISDIYVSYTGGALECTVETYPEEISYTYDMDEREANAPRNNRLKVGKGLNSRYWRLDFTNVNGADFQIYDVTLNAAVSKNRRI